MRSAKNNAFSILELLVAMGLLSGLIVISVVVFDYSLEAHKHSEATMEIMRNLRTITSQIDSDFRGLRKESYFFINFAGGPTVSDPNRPFADRIAFFADGDFHTLRSDYCNDLAHPLRASSAAICYAQSGAFNPLAKDDSDFEADTELRAAKLLLRRRRIFTARPRGGNANELPSTSPAYEDEYMDVNSISVWMNDWRNAGYSGSAVNELLNRPDVSGADADSLHMYWCKGVDDFRIQLHSPAWPNAITSDGEINWYPPDDTTASGNYTVMPQDIDPDYPTAIKFSFTLYDSEGVFKDGKRFSHIVYIGD